MAIQFVDWGPIIWDPNWEGTINNALRAKFKVGAAAMEAMAIAYAPVDTGELRGSIKARVRQPSGRIFIELTATAEHAHWVEYGTGRRGTASWQSGGAASPSDMAAIGLPDFYKHGAVEGVWAQPYLRPALIHGLRLIGEWGG